ncbi:hypothetical protein [Phormidesmis priestleyi]
MSVGAPSSPGGNATNDIFKGQGTIDNARFNGPGNAQMVVARQGKGGSLLLSNAGRFSVEYIGTVRRNFEGSVELQVNQFRSSEKGFRTVPASGTCNVQTSGGVLCQSFCTVTGAGIDHGRSNFRAR